MILNLEITQLVVPFHIVGENGCGKYRVSQILSIQRCTPAVPLLPEWVIHSTLLVSSSQLDMITIFLSVHALFENLFYHVTNGLGTEGRISPHILHIQSGE
jgi:hypothetical protein